MNKFESSPNQNTGNAAPDARHDTNPNPGETTHRHKRTRAPQFGSDRRNTHDTEAKRPGSGQVHRDHDGVARHGSRGGQVERRRATRDRRHSYW